MAYMKEDVVLGATWSDVTRTSVRAFLEGEKSPHYYGSKNPTELTRSSVVRTSDASDCVASRGTSRAPRNMDDGSGTKEQELRVPRLLNVHPAATCQRSQTDIIHAVNNAVETPPIAAAPNNASQILVCVDQPAKHTKSLPLSELVIDPERVYVLQVKGWSKANMGMGLGMVLFDPSSSDNDDDDEGAVRWEARQHCTTYRPPLVAEYCAMVVALQHIIKCGVQRLVLETNNEILHNQLVGTYLVNRGTLNALHRTVMNLIENVLREFSVHLVSKYDNDRADELASEALATGKTSNISVVVDPLRPLPCNVTAGNDFNERVLDGLPHKDMNLMDIIDPHAKYRLQFDGGVRGKSNGIAGAGMVLYDENGKEVWAGWKYLDFMSHNAAEYCALVLGLRCARSLGVRTLIAEGDSEHIIMQVSRESSIGGALLPLWEATKEVIREFDSVRLQHVFRRHNMRADWLARHAMNTKSSYGFAELDAKVSTDS